MNVNDKNVLNSHLEDKSYICGFEPTQIDTKVFSSIDENFLVSKKHNYPHLWRWYLHIKSFAAGINDFPVFDKVRILLFLPSQKLKA